jgi:hypothetical protein
VCLYLKYAPDLVFGVISEKSIMEKFSKTNNILDYVEIDPPIISKNSSYGAVGFLLKENEIVLIKDKEKIKFYDNY